MDVRQQQAKALSKLGTVSGMNEKGTFKQWKDKAEQLALVKRAMAPLGGKRTKGLAREYFQLWHQVVQDTIEDAKKEAFCRMVFDDWKKMVSCHLIDGR